MTHIGRLYNSFVWAAVISAALFQNTWLEMRVNMGIVLFALFAIFFVVSAIWNISFSLLFTTLSLALSAAAGVFFLGVSRMCVLPALIIREGLGVRLVSVSVINAVVTALLVIGYALMLWDRLRDRYHRR